MPRILKDAIPGESMAQDDVNARHMIWEAEFGVKVAVVWCDEGGMFCFFCVNGVVQKNNTKQF